MNSLDIRTAMMLFSAALLCGCQGGDPAAANRERTYSASGTVTYNQAPVAGAHVSFRPREGGVPAFGRTDASGRFTLQTYEAGDGAAAGSYTVTVEKMSVPAADQTKSSDELFAQMEQQAKSGETPSEAEPESLLPEKYRNPGTSELTVEVRAEGGNEFKFDLTD